MQRIGFGLVDIVLGQLVVGDRVEALDAGGDVAIRDALNFQLVHSGEIRDLLEGDGRVVHQPDGSGLRHDRFAHLVSPSEWVGPEYVFPGACRDRLHLVGVRVSVVGELGGYIVRENALWKSE